MTIKAMGVGKERDLVVVYRAKKIQTPDAIRRSSSLEPGDSENGICGSLISQSVLTSKQGSAGASLRSRTPAYSTHQRDRVDAEGMQISDWLEHELGLTRMQ